MYYLPLLIVCSLAPGYVGDKDSGSTCLQFWERPEVHYTTLEQCANRVRELQQEIMRRPERLAIEIPGPYHFRGKCLAPVIDEKST